MRKGTIEIFLNNETPKIVDGYISKEFGFYKNEFKNYDVTHLKTGLKILSFMKMKHAKRFVELLEETTFPIPFCEVTREGILNNTIEIWKNANTVMELSEKAKNL